MFSSMVDKPVTKSWLHFEAKQGHEYDKTSRLKQSQVNRLNIIAEWQGHKARGQIKFWLSDKVLASPKKFWPLRKSFDLSNKDISENT